MPIGKSGKYHISPHNMRQAGDEPDGKPGSAHHEAGKAEGEMHGGDGMHHHEMHGSHESGFHSKHTDPDGHVTEADHGSYDEAKQHMDAMHGESEEPDGDETGIGSDNDGDEPDIASMYDRG